MNSTDAIVSGLQQVYISTVYDKDASSFMSLYNLDVGVLDAWGVWVDDGSRAWRTALEDWFSSLGDERMKVTFEDTRSFETLAAIQEESNMAS